MSSPHRDADLPVPPWSARRHRPARGRAPLSRDAIVDAAMAILDAEGFDAMTMRRVATALGTGPASLYAHVAGKDELLELMIDRVAAEQDVPDPDPENWQEQVKDGIRGIYRSFLAHPGLARANLGRIPTGPGALHTMDRFLGILRAGGLPDRVVAFAADLLPLYATAYAFEQSIFTERMSQEEGERYMAELDAYWKSLPAERFPNLAALSGELMAEPDPDARFEFGLDALVTGIAAMGRR